jgi:hypothetical protein
MAGVMASAFCSLIEFGLDADEVVRPGEFDQQRHHDRGEDRVARVIGQANGQKTKHERLGVLPVPEILVHEENRDDKQAEREFPEHGQRRDSVRENKLTPRIVPSVPAAGTSAPAR